MLSKSFLLVLQALGATATWSAYQEYVKGLPKKITKCASPRPTISFDAIQPYEALPSSAARHKTCYVKSHDDFKTDDSAYVLDAARKCNHGGQVVFPQGVTYVIGKALDLTFLKSVDLDIQGYIQFTNDTDYWQANAFKQVFQNATTFFQLGGQDVNVYGGGMLDGNGQVWYDLYAADALILRPILFGTIGLKSGSISNIDLRYSPQWYNLLANSTDVVFDSLTISGYSQSEHEAKNTDGWDTYRSSNVVIQNSVINNGDDCVSFKPNSTEILVQNLYCNGSHGISVGSLGQYPGEVDIVENIYVYNISMYNASDGARIKVWPGASSALSVDLQGGGGLGRVNNVTYKDMYIENVDYAVEVTQCYGQKNLTLCNQFPSNLTISGVDISGIHGTTSKKYDPISGYVVCSSPSVCNDIKLEDVKVTSPKGVTNAFKCGNVDESLLQGINCTKAT
ncbi:Putative glycoside hydrolase, family 28, pectin lyase/virulence factor [Septoria linicola]|uniref:galacturonan 1,4-alpha-galacturonidase n=1 Tax=Septoria linicola TaxID=215465 RepID=A0A9Q9ARR0_9PEZI|nr:putative glycoside hydrolase, family 28, pectin lyase/virulence factor [Septoria linicola]USW53900.1 Putative glycoside hydrolase, family 28, pectin lyase/virulence factor [Septoria linicola]